MYRPPRSRLCLELNCTVLLLFDVNLIETLFDCTRTHCMQIHLELEYLERRRRRNHRRREHRIDAQNDKETGAASSANEGPSNEENV